MGRHTVNYTKVTTGQGVIDAVNTLEKKIIVAVDTETTGLDPLVDKVLLIQIGDAKQQFIFDIAKIGLGNLQPLLFWLPNKKVFKIAHNMKFDYSMIKANLGIDMENVACTMIGEQLLTRGRTNQKASLEVVSDKYLGVKMDKRELLQPKQ